MNSLQVRFIVPVIMLALHSSANAASDPECLTLWEATTASESCRLLSDLTKMQNESGVFQCRVNVSCIAPGTYTEKPGSLYSREISNRMNSDLAWPISLMKGGLNNCNGMLTFRSC
jgi:hypothetical protein